MNHGGGSNMIKVLVVDDEKIVRKGIIALFPWRSFNMKVAGEAESYTKALEFLENNDVDLMFVDLVMPGESGFELIKEVNARYPSIWTVVLTCHQDFNYIQDALRLGAIDYIVKTQLELEPVEEVLKRIAARIEDGKRNVRAQDLADIETAAFDNKYPEEINEGILNALSYIDSNITNHINQEEAAKRANMSKGYFSRCFKEIVGKLFVEYVQEAKMKKAMELLQEGNRPIYWIAEQLGYQDEKYFSRLFKGFTGMLPSEYRKQRE
jgi:two-component system response regulator YesN